MKVQLRGDAQLNPRSRTWVPQEHNLRKYNPCSGQTRPLTVAPTAWYQRIGSPSMAHESTITRNGMRLLKTAARARRSRSCSRESCRPRGGRPRRAGSTRCGGSSIRAHEAPEMLRPCRDGADRAERHDWRLTSSSSSSPPSSFSPSCHPLPHPRVPRLGRSCRDCTGRVRGVSSGKYIMRGNRSFGNPISGAQTSRAELRRSVSSARARKRACGARDGGRIPG
jgi:hypothetical protein